MTGPPAPEDSAPLFRPWDLLAGVALAGLTAPESVRLLTGGGLPTGWTWALLAAVAAAHLAVPAGRWRPLGAFVVAAVAALLFAVAPDLHGRTATELGAPVPPILVPSTLAFSAALFRLAARAPLRAEAALRERLVHAVSPPPPGGCWNR